MTFRTYQKEDKAVLNQIFQSNCPKYFHESELALFNDFLEHVANENFLVALNDSGKIIGCGGYYEKDDHYGISWTMFANKSIGAAQLMTSGNTMYQELMSRIQQTNRAKDILISTSKYMERLFSHYGFKTYQIIKDGFGEGLDKYKMRKAY